RSGILINLGANHNTIGGSTKGASNVLSANTESGIFIQHDGSTANRVQGKYIGTDFTGTTIRDDKGNSLGNGLDGVTIDAAPNNTIGGLADAARNFIAGNTHDGIEVTG